MTDSTIHASDIQQAQARISSEIAPTPLQYCARLSAETGCEVYLKREDLQDVRSYKIRGALNGMSNLPQEQRHRGIVTASAGNHAQGVAYACRTMGIAGKIFVPEPTPMQKRDRILVHGGDQVELVVVGSNFDEAAAAAHADAAERDAAFIEPFDARDTITGQGTVAAEVLAQLSAKGKSPDAVVVPVGGGGLISGITSYLADMAPDTRVVGMEPEGAASLRAAFDHGGPVTLDAVDPFVDGAAVKRLGALPYEILDANRERLSFDTVSEGAVCTDLLNLYQNEGIIAEPAGALSVAVSSVAALSVDALSVAVSSSDDEGGVAGGVECFDALFDAGVGDVREDLAAGGVVHGEGAVVAGDPAAADAQHGIDREPVWRVLRADAAGRAELALVEGRGERLQRREPARRHRRLLGSDPRSHRVLARHDARPGRDRDLRGCPPHLFARRGPARRRRDRDAGRGP